jgi:hypothetical protein
MSEPTRLRDEGPDAVRALLRHAPRTRTMTAADRSRTRARVARLAGLAAGLGSLAWLQGAAIGAGLGVLAVGAAEVVPTWLSPAPTAARARLAVSAAPVAPAGPVVAVATIAPSAEAAAPPASASTEPPPSRSAARLPEAPAPSADEAASAPPPPDSLAQEAALLERARAALGASPAEALALTEAHAAQFPGAKLGMERELVAIDALRRLGRVADARARGEALLPRARGGLYEERIKKLLDGMR